MLQSLDQQLTAAAAVQFNTLTALAAIKRQALAGWTPLQANKEEPLTVTNGCTLKPDEMPPLLEDGVVQAAVSAAHTAVGPTDSLPSTVHTGESALPALQPAAHAIPLTSTIDEAQASGTGPSVREGPTARKRTKSGKVSSPHQKLSNVLQKHQS